MGQPAALRRLLEAQERERVELTAELVKVRGMMPLLMKRRNGGRWTVDERHELIEQLHALAHLSPYLVVLALPGSFMFLPVLAWWLDRRRQQRRHQPADANANACQTGNATDGRMFDPQQH